MAQTVIITLTTAGADTGPFDLYSNIDGYSIPFESNVAKVDLEAGYVSSLVPDSASTIRVQSDSVLCSNYVDLSIVATTTTTTTPTPTTTTTTTAAPTTTTTTTLDETMVSIENNVVGSAGVQITSLSVSGKTFTVTSGAFPLDQGESLVGVINGQGTFDLTVGVSVSTPGDPDKLIVTDSNAVPTCEAISSGGAYVYNSQVCDSTTTVFINATEGTC